MLITLLIVPPIFAGLLFLFPFRRTANVALGLYALIHIATAVALSARHESFTRYFAIDDFNILFLDVLSVVFVATTVYLVGQFSRANVGGRDPRYARFAAFLLLFVDSMNGAILSTHLGLLWVFLEASTLTSVVLVNYNGTRSSLEAAWKYVFICSIGISFAFIGVIFLGAADMSIRSLFFADLNRAAPSMSIFWLRLSFAFVLIGFGTKMGLAPVHSWLPDAHSEGPAPASALLSGALLNVALFGILKVDRILNLAGQSGFARGLLLVMGFLSLFVSSVFILSSVNYKRMLAYSSIEHMGIIAIGIGLGGLGVLAALLHMIGHSLSKSAFFLTSGNVHDLTGSNLIESARGLRSRHPATAALVLACFLAISAAPPFSTFLSEFLLVRALFAQNAVLLGLFLLLVVVILYGMGTRVLEISSERSPVPTVTESPSEHGKSKIPTIWGVLPQLFLLLLAAILGVYLPGPIWAALHRAAAYLGG
ncbi:MAG TPA: proton-conducting transporter membrane subunit [Spirochaetia bacterium]|nr:proton-conducting transporter membrane subunit [Spirochaetia bacterium]